MVNNIYDVRTYPEILACNSLGDGDGYTIIGPYPFWYDYDGLAVDVFMNLEASLHGFTGSGYMPSTTTEAERFRGLKEPS